jgi:hypothetical protein
MDAGRGSAEQIARLASRPTPQTVHGLPDLNGAGAIEFVLPQVLPDGSVLCITRCGDGPGPGSGPAVTDSPAAYTRSFPSYRPEFQAQVPELSENQVRTDTSLRCDPPGVPRLGPPRKIVQTANEVANGL